MLRKICNFLLNILEKEIDKTLMEYEKIKKDMKGENNNG